MCFMVLVNKNNPGHNLVWPHYKIKKYMIVNQWEKTLWYMRKQL